MKASKVRDGVTIKIRKDTYRELAKVIGGCLAKSGKKMTYSDIIDALIKCVPDPVKAVEMYVEKQKR
jgi:predicted CopG family antitoxin